MIFYYVDFCPYNWLCKKKYTLFITQDKEKALHFAKQISAMPYKIIPTQKNDVPKNVLYLSQRLEDSNLGRYDIMISEFDEFGNPLNATYQSFDL